MSILITQDINNTGLEQNFRLYNNTNISSIRLYLMKHNTPTGNIIIQIKMGSTVIKEVTVPINELNEAVESTYGHGMFNFDLNMSLNSSSEYKEYTINVKTDSYDSNNHYRWCRDWQTEYSDLYGESSTEGDAEASYRPLKFELIEYK